MEGKNLVFRYDKVCWLPIGSHPLLDVIAIACHSPYSVYSLVGEQTKPKESNKWNICQSQTGSKKIILKGED